jgi:hypothetical protein
MADMVFFVHGLPNQLWVVDTNLGIVSGDELKLVTNGFIKS